MNIVWAGTGNPDLNAALGNWCAAQIFGNGDHFAQPFSTMGIFDGDALVAVVLYNNWHPQAGVIEMHAASVDKRWLSRKTLGEMFRYPFETIGAQMVVLRVSERNVMWNGRGLPRLLKAYGFKSYLIPRLRGRDENEILYTLTDDDWRANRFHKETA